MSWAPGCGTNSSWESGLQTLLGILSQDLSLLKVSLCLSLFICITNDNSTVYTHYRWTHAVCTNGSSRQEEDAVREGVGDLLLLCGESFLFSI